MGMCAAVHLIGLCAAVHLMSFVCCCASDGFCWLAPLRQLVCELLESSEIC